ncbi:MAG: DUF3667 domain-containing protein [Burkholderiales bacterium]|nr:DUF3667 domain-containing protein [Burkholderiales bacterium]
MHPPTLGEFLHEFVGHYVALEGALWRTLRMLVTRPGQLTREYLDGRRRQYVLPLRLYLTASFVFFLVLRIAAASMQPETEFKVDGRKVPAAEYEAMTASHAATAASLPTAPKVEQEPAGACGGPGQRACGRVEAVFNESLKRLQAHPQEEMARTREHLLHWAPYAVFVLLPAFAGIMMLVYRRRRMTYGEHFVFSLHLHAFWFIAGLALLVLPAAVSDVAQLGVVAYGVWAMREAYGGRWWPTALRALTVIALYGVTLSAAMIVLGAAVVAGG